MVELNLNGIHKVLAYADVLNSLNILAAVNRKTRYMKI
jgi:hypothetical protein